MERSTQKKKKKNFLTYGLAIFLMLFFVNIATAYIMHYYVVGSSCMTKVQVAADSRCLYILGNQVYEQGSRSSPHHGHPCGTDVTAIIPADHINNPAVHLLPNYIADICAAATPTPTLTLTPIPKPTSTPTPTLKPTVAPTATSTPGQKPTSIPFTSTPTIKPTVAVIIPLTNTAIPVRTATPIQFLTSAPIPAVHNTITPKPTTIAIAVQHTVTTTPISYLTITSPPTVTNIPQITNIQNPTGSIPSISSSIIPPSITQTTGSIIPGDIDRNGIVDIADYNALLRCYGLSVANPSPVCPSPGPSDLDNDGKVDAVDYNIFLSDLYQYRQKNNLLPSPTVALSPSLTPSVSASPTTIPHTTPTTTASIPSVTKKPSSPITAVAKQRSLPRLTSIPTKKASPIGTFVAGVTNNAAFLTQLFDWIIFIIFCATLVIGIVRSKLLLALLKKKINGKSSPPQVASSVSVPTQSSVIEGLYYVKLQNETSPLGKSVSLVDGDTQIKGYYKGEQISEGFAKIKGIKRDDNGEKYIEISEILPVSV